MAKHFIGSEKPGCPVCLGDNPKMCPACYGHTWLCNWFMPSGFATWKHLTELTESDREEFYSIKRALKEGTK